MTTPLSEAEQLAAKSIGELLAGYQLDTVTSAYKAAINRMLGQLLVAGWELQPATDHALLFGDAILSELGQAKARKLQVH
jgi:hypothetical protein